MKRQSSILALVAASLFSAAAAAMDNDATVSPAAWEQPLNNIAQVACHNCYEPQYSLNGRAFSAVLDYVKTIEIDFWDQRDIASGGAQAQHWFVRHDGATQQGTSGNENSCTDNATGANDLRACLTDVRNWSRAHPGHFPLIVILDKKQGWSEPSGVRAPGDLDALVKEILGDALYTPAQLDRFHARQAGTLRDKVRAAGWPLAKDLRGRILLVLNGNGLDGYLEALGLAGAIFVSPSTDSASEVTGLPHGISEANAQLVVMHNMNAAHRAVSAAVYQQHFIGRVWGNDKEDFARQIANRTHLSAYYDYAAQRDGSYRILPITPVTVPDHGLRPGL
jgi:hypothetical protein